MKSKKDKEGVLKMIKAVGSDSIQVDLERNRKSRNIV